MPDTIQYSFKLSEVALKACSVTVKRKVSKCVCTLYEITQEELDHNKVTHTGLIINTNC
jgi:hypothetical protein